MEQVEDGPDMELGQLGSGPVVEIDSAGDHEDLLILLIRTPRMDI